MKMQVLLMRSVDVRVVLLSCFDERVDIRCWNKGASRPAAGPRLFTFRKGKSSLSQQKHPHRHTHAHPSAFSHGSSTDTHIWKTRLNRLIGGIPLRKQQAN